MALDADVLVIGAGLAGLVAARDVAADGRRVTVLEARDRIGGRTWTSTLPGTAIEVDYGGTWVHPDAQPAVAAEIQRHGLAMRAYPAPELEVWAHGGQRQTGLGDWGRTLAAFDDAFDAIATGLDTDDPEAWISAPDGLDVTVNAWLAARQEPASSGDALRAIAAAMVGGHPDEVGLWPLVVDQVANGYRLDEGWSDIGLSFVGGARTLVDAIADGLEIRLGQVVTAIRDLGAEVEVITAGGLRLQARAAIVTVPLNTWRGIEFDPPLDGGKRAAARRGHPGRSSKVLAVARNVPSGLAAIGWDTPLQAMYALGEVDGGELLVGFSGMDPIDGADRTAVTAAIRAFAPEAEVVASGGHDWIRDPYSAGTWFAEPAGWRVTTMGEDLEAPVGRVAFAGGDLPTVGAGWIEGAIASGGRAARRTLELIG